MYILGINSVYHESAACLLDDGVVVAAAEEERFTRIKHAKTPRMDNPDELPLHAMQYCLETAAIDIRQVEHVGYSSDPRRRLGQYGYSAMDWDVEFTHNIMRTPGRLRVMGFEGRFAWVDHHTAHAASAFYPSPFAAAAVISVDGIGDNNTTASFSGADRKLRCVQDIASPHSLGFLWEVVSMFLGFDIYDATKIMGLAAYGDPDRYAKHFGQLLRLLPHGRFEVNSDLLRFWLLDYLKPSGYFRGLERLFGFKRRTGDEELSQAHRDISAALQSVTDKVVLHLAEHLHKRTGAENLCLAGGVTLNCVTNQYAFERGPFSGLYVQPAAHDAGTAIGAAMYIWHHKLGHARCDGMASPYVGPEFSDSQIESELQHYGLSYSRADDIEKEVAGRLCEGALVGYFQGRMEIGPRALGNRSLLADPRDPNMREVLNQRIKHREDFRPFAPSVLYEEARRWFEIGKETPAYEYMLMACPIADAMLHKIPAVSHVDGTSRIQVVRREANPRYHRLISEFEQLTGVPVVLNTSFNDTEPIVCSPEDAIRTFLRTEIDYLALGDFLVSKEANRDVQLGERRKIEPVAGLVSTTTSSQLVDVQGYNRAAWDNEVALQNPWTIPVDSESIRRARHGKWEIYLTPTRPVPCDWWPDLNGLKTLCLAGGGGQQGPVLAAAGAKVTVLDTSDKQLQQDRRVARRDGLEIETVQGEMADLSRFADESFDLVVHAVANVYTPDVRPVWQEAFRVLRPGGTMIAGFDSPVRHIFDLELAERGELQVRHRLPYSDLTSLTEEELQRRIQGKEPLMFGHTLEEQIGGQIAAGFLIAGFFEDQFAENDGDALSRYIATFAVTRAVKPV